MRTLACLALVLSACAHAPCPAPEVAPEPGWDARAPGYFDVFGTRTQLAIEGVPTFHFPRGGVFRFRADRWERLRLDGVQAAGVMDDGGLRLLAPCDRRWCVTDGAKVLQVLELPERLSMLHFDGSGRLHAFGYDSCHQEGYMTRCTEPFHAMLESGGWRKEGIPAAPAALASAPGGTLHMLSESKGRVFRSALGAEGWRREELAAFPPGDWVYVNEYRLDPEAGELALIAQRSRRQLAHWIARRQGDRWSLDKIHEEELGNDGSSQAQAIVDSRGRLHVILAVVGTEGYPMDAKLLHARREGDGWRIVEVERGQLLQGIAPPVEDSCGGISLIYGTYVGEDHDAEGRFARWFEGSWETGPLPPPLREGGEWDAGLSTTTLLGR